MPQARMPPCLQYKVLRTTGAAYSAGHATLGCWMTSEHTWPKSPSCLGPVITCRPPTWVGKRGSGPAGSLVKDTCAPAGQIPEKHIMCVTQRIPQPGGQAKVAVGWPLHVGKAARQRMPWRRSWRVSGGREGAPLSPSAQSQISSLLTLDTR